MAGLWSYDGWLLCPDDPFKCFLLFRMEKYSLYIWFLWRPYAPLLPHLIKDSEITAWWGLTLLYQCIFYLKHQYSKYLQNVPDVMYFCNCICLISCHRIKNRCMDIRLLATQVSLNRWPTELDPCDNVQFQKAKRLFASSNTPHSALSMGTKIHRV